MVSPGRVTNNDINNQTLATIERGSTVTSTGGVSVRALDESSTISVAGAVAFGGKAGIGASIALNEIQIESKPGWMGRQSLRAGP